MIERTIIEYPLTVEELEETLNYYRRVFQKNWCEKCQGSHIELQIRNSVCPKEFDFEKPKGKSKSKCYLCGYDDPRALEFHHRDPNEKEFTISNIICANCNRIMHFKKEK